MGVQRITVVLVLMAAGALAWAGGQKDFDGKAVNGKENWDYRYELKDQKPGQYNLVIEGKDKAGNTSVAGPFNIWIDPASDIPVITIINPVAAQRVGENLNIVGTCLDDDGVERVEIQLDGGEALKASGTEYWSYYLKGKDIPDGPHTITVIGYDIKGVPSKPVSASFNLDKAKPVNAVSSHENGMLVSGQVSLKGTVNDANGVARLSYSLDGGKAYQEIGVQRGKENSKVEFRMDIDTRRLKDGPNVFWLRSVDQTKSIGVSAFLLMVDNTKPEIRVINPLPGMSVHGKFGLAGMIFDAVGVRQLSWELGGKTTELKLFPGNPFFAAELDLAGITAKETVVILRATDISGNQQELRYPIKIDNQPDLPVVESANLADKAVIGPRFELALNIRDDDGVGSLLYTLDKESERELPAQESSVLTLEGMATGPHALSLRAKDSLGVVGPTKTINFTVRGEAPRLSAGSLTVDASPRFNTSIPRFVVGGEQPFQTGMRVLQDGQNRLKINVDSQNKLKLVEIQFGDDKWLPMAAAKENKPGTPASYSVELPRNLHFGRVAFQARATDEFDQVGQFGSVFQVVNYARINEEPAVVFMDSRIKEDGMVALSATHPLEGLFVGSEAHSIRLEPPSDTVKAELDGNRIIISYLKDGLSKPTAIVVSSREKHEIRSRSFIFRTDSTPPVFSSISPRSGSLVGNELTAAVVAEDQGGIETAEWSLDQGANWTPGDFKPGQTRIDRSAKVDISALPEGPFVLLLRCADTSGNETVQAIALVKDATKPQISLDAPLESAWGFQLVGGHVSDAGRLSKLEYRLGEGPFQALPSLDKRFVLPLDFGTEPSGALSLTIRAVDLAGNLAEEQRTVTPAPTPEAAPPSESAKPKAVLLSPGPAEAVHGKIQAAFQFTDRGDAYPVVRFTAPGQAARDISAEIKNQFFLADLDLGAIKGASANCSFEFESADRKKISQAVSIKLAPEADRPLVRQLWMDPASSWVAVVAEDDDGIQKYQITIDNKPVESAETGPAILVPIPKLAVGSHTLGIAVTDSNGLASAKAESKFMVRGEAPSISTGNLVQGAQSQAFTNGSSLIPGKDDRLSIGAVFPNGFKSLEYRLNGTAGGAKASGSGTSGKLDIPLGGGLAWGLNTLELIATDLTGLQDQRQIFFYRLAAEDPAGVDDVAVVLDSGQLGPDGLVKLGPDASLNAFFTGRPIKSLSLQPPDKNLETSFDGNAIKLRPLNPLLSGDLRLVVTDLDGDRFESAPFKVQADAEPPRISLERPALSDWLQSTLSLSGSVSDQLGFERLEYLVNGVPKAPAAGDEAAAPEAGEAPADTRLNPEPGVWQSLETALPGPDGKRAFKAEINLSGFQDGTVLLGLRAYDSFGNRSEQLLAFNKDTLAPVVVQLTPPEAEKVNGTITTTGKARDAGRIARIEFSSDRQSWKEIPAGDLFVMDLDFASYAPLPDRFWWRVSDRSGNTTLISPKLNVDQESDRPVVTVQTPGELETLRNDFKISGLAFDDDGVANLYYRLDYQGDRHEGPALNLRTFGPLERPQAGQAGVMLSDIASLRRQVEPKPDLSTFTKIEGKQSFELAMNLLQLGDNEHRFEIVAEDINRTLGRVVERPFRVSTAEPSSQLALPATGTVVRGTYRMEGSASDANGIAEIWLSFDSGTSWSKASGKESWSYNLDTTTLKDGVHSVIIKSVDNYGTEGLYNSIITTDNRAPSISLDTPLDGAQESGTLRLSGRIADNLALSSAMVSLIPADKTPGNKDTLEQALSTKTVLLQDLDISQLKPGWYTLRIELKDRAENLAWISRDIRIVETRQADRVEISFPLENELVSGYFTVTGKVSTKGPLPAMVRLLVGSPGMDNYQVLGEYPVSKTGHFNASVDPMKVVDGTVDLVAVVDPNPQPASDPSLPADAEGAPPAPSPTADKPADAPPLLPLVRSQPRLFEYRRSGPWIKFESFSGGDYLSQRIFLKGSAGHFQEPAWDASDESKNRAQDPGKRLAAIHVSYDHGISWQAISGTDQWSYRIETQNYPNGELFILFRLTLENGETAVRHAIMVVDRTPPVITVLKPGEEGRYNESLDIAGTASDNYELDSIKVLLRTGDKANYAVPSFIQGMYLSGQYGGASTWEAALGLSFFDNNVKLQAVVGQAPADTRFDGWALGVKLIANVAYLPFSYFFGPDLDFFSMSIGIGAQFNYMTMSGANFEFSDKGLVLGAALLQWELARFSFPGVDFFKNVGLYTEGQIWFISSDVQASIMPKVVFGGRVGLF